MKRWKRFEIHLPMRAKNSLYASGLKSEESWVDLRVSRMPMARSMTVEMMVPSGGDRVPFFASLRPMMPMM